MIGALLAAGLTIQPASGSQADVFTVREKAIAKTEDESGWPFVAKSGKLACMPWTPRPGIFFYPDEGPAKETGIVLDFNPYGLMLNNWTTGKPLLPYGSPEELNRRIAPYIAKGLALCEKQEGRVAPDSEP